MAEPMYRMIAQELMEEIQAGDLRPGDQIPTELELRDKHNASRNTIRDAVKWLVNRGLVETRPGQGTFVTTRIVPFVTTLSYFSDTGLSGIEGRGWLQEVADRGRTASFSLPRVEVQTASDDIAERLRLQPGTQVIIRQQERYVDRMPFSLQSTAYPLALLQEGTGAPRLLVAEDIEDGAVTYLGEQLGLREVGYQDSILVRAPREDETRFFRIPDDGRVSVVSVARTGYRDHPDGPVPLRVTFTVFPADRNQFVINSGDVPKGLPGQSKG